MLSDGDLLALHINSADNWSRLEDSKKPMPEETANSASPCTPCIDGVEECVCSKVTPAEEAQQGQLDLITV